jgi:hypothetical protein
VIESRNAQGRVVATTRIQFIINVGAGGSANQPPVWDSPPTPADATEFTVTPGNTLNCTLQASDPDAGDSVSIVQNSGPGTFTPTNGNPATGAFSYTPTAADVVHHPRPELRGNRRWAGRRLSAACQEVDRRLRGRVKRALLGRRNTVVIKRLVCGRYRKVGQAKPDRNGNYVARFSVPANVTVALFRAESLVLNKPHSRRYVKQYARAISITLTSQTG